MKVAAEPRKSTVSRVNQPAGGGAFFAAEPTSVVEASPLAEPFFPFVETGITTPEETPQPEGEEPKDAPQNQVADTDAQAEVEAIAPEKENDRETDEAKEEDPEEQGEEETDKEPKPEAENKEGEEESSTEAKEEVAEQKAPLAEKKTEIGAADKSEVVAGAPPNPDVVTGTTISAVTPVAEEQPEKQGEEESLEEVDPAAKRAVRTWKRKVGRATQQVSGGDTTALTSSPQKMQQRGGAVVSGFKSDKKDHRSHLKAKVKPAPEPEKAPPPPAPDPVPKATALVKKAASHKLPSQTLPSVTRSPGHEKVNGGVGVLPDVQPALRDAKEKAEKATLSEESGEGKQKTNPNQEKLAENFKKAAPAAGEGGVPAPITVSGTEVPVARPVSGARKEDIGDSIAEVLVRKDTLSTRFVDSAVKMAYPGGALQEEAPTIIDDLKEEEKVAIENHLQLAAEAAGIAKEQLQQKAAVAKERIDKAAGQANKGVEEEGDKSTEKVKEKGDKANKSISKEAERVENEVIAKQEAAGGQVDLKLIEAKRDRLLKKINDTIAKAKADYDYAAKKRKQALRQNGNQQAAAYQRTAKYEGDKIRAQYEDLIEGRVAAKPTMDWGRAGSKKNKDQVDLLSWEIDDKVKTWKGELDTAGITARDKIRDWAADKSGRERSWWDRLIDMFKDWANQSLREKAAYEAAEAQLTLDEVNGDFAKLDEIKRAMATGNKEEADRIMATLSAEEKAVVSAFLGSGGDSVKAVSVGLLIRLEAKRVPKLKEEAVAKSLKLEDWEKLNALGKSQNSSFDARVISRNVFDAVEGWGTNESKIYKNLQGLTPVQAAAVKKAYRLYHGESLESALKGDLSGEEEKRALRQLEGDATGADVAALRYAVAGPGTDEATIYTVLRGKSPAERAALKKRYFEEYGVELMTDLKGDMEGLELDRGEALLDGNVAKADAIGLEDARQSGWFSPDHEAADAIYQQIQQEADAEADKRGWSAAERDAEIRRRNGEVADQYGTRFAGGKKDALKDALSTSFSGPERDLLLGRQAYDPAAIDAAQMRMETDNLFVTNDEKVNAILRNQKDRATRDATLNFRTKMIDLKETADREKWPPEKRKAAREALQKERQAEIKRTSKKNMEAFQSRYEGKYDRFLRLDIAFTTSGYSQDMAFDLLAQNGHLDPEQEVYYSVRGPGTNLPQLKGALDGKSKEEIKKIKADYKKRYGTDMVADIEGDTSGRDAKDLEWILRGKPENPKEMLDLLKEKQAWEKEHGRGFFGSLIGAASSEERTLDLGVADAEREYQALQEAIDKHGKDSSQVKELEADFYRKAGYVQGDIDQYRKGVDRVADYLATAAELTIVAAGVVAGLIFTGGSTSAGILALYATGIAAGSAAAGMAVRAAVKGDAYGWEDIGRDAAVGTADVIFAALTAGMSKALLAGGKLAKLAEGTIGKRLLAHFIAEGIEGAAGALPPALMGSVLSDATWQSGDPLGTILENGLTASAQAFALSGVLGSTGGISKPKKQLAKHLDYDPGKMFDAPTKKNQGDFPKADDLIDLDPAAKKKLPPPESLADNGLGKPLKDRLDEIADSPTAKRAAKDAGPDLPNAKPEVSAGLPRDLRKKVSVKADPDLVGNSVKIHYDLGEDQLIRNLEIRVGPGATAADVAAHSRTVRQMRLYSGKIGRAAQLMERINVFTKYAGDPPVGSRAWQARFELDKLGRIHKKRLRDLSRKALNAEEEGNLRFEIADLEKRIDGFQRTLDEMDVNPGSGFVASEAWVDRNKPELKNLLQRDSTLPLPKGYRKLDDFLAAYNIRMQKNGAIGFSRKKDSKAPRLLVVYPPGSTDISKAKIELHVDGNVDRLSRLNADLITDTTKLAENPLPASVKSWDDFAKHYGIHRSQSGEYFVVRKNAGQGDLPEISLLKADGSRVMSDADLAEAIFVPKERQRLSLGGRKEKFLRENSSLGKPAKGLADLEKKLKANPALTAEDKAWIRRRAPLFRKLSEGQTASQRKAMFEDFLDGATGGFGEKFDDALRRKIRKYALDQVFAEPDLTKRQTLLDELLGADNSLKGELLKERIIRGSDGALAKGSRDHNSFTTKTNTEGDALTEFTLGDTGRKVDLAFEKTDTGNLAGLPKENGAYGVESKAGEGAFKADQAADYLLDLARTPIAGSKGGSSSIAFKGLIYVADNLDNADGIVEKLEAKATIKKIIKRFEARYGENYGPHLETALGRLYVAGYQDGKLVGVDLGDVRKAILADLE